MGSNTKIGKLKNEMKFFHKHIVEGKTVQKCAKEMGMHYMGLHKYKNGEDFRKMAIEYFEDSTLKGLKGTASRLIDKLDSVDVKTSMSALQEIKKIYGL